MKLLRALPIWLAICACTPSVKTYDLRCEGLDQPLATDTAVPRFSWKVFSGTGASQEAYQIQLSSSRDGFTRPDIWDSGKVESADQILVPYAGPALDSRRICWWRVRVWTGDGEASAWSGPRRLGIGVIGEDSIAGDFIGALPGQGRSALLRKKFDLRKSGRGTYVLHVCSLGYHEVYVNGYRVGDAVLTPAVSQLDRRALTVTYDISDFLGRGANEIVLWTSSGWYKPATFKAEYDGALVKAELDFVDDGSQCVLSTDGSWEGSWSGYSDIGSWRAWDFGGEIIDARAVPSSMDALALDSLEWVQADVVKVKDLEQTPQMCEPCRVQETVAAVSIEHFGENKWVADMGCVVNGLLQTCLPALPEGTEVTALYYDNNPSGTDCMQCGSSVLVSSGRREGDLFTGRFNSNVFRYVVFENLPEKPVAVNALRVRTDYRCGASFKCSDPDLQAIYDMISYTMENLAFDGYMVDCASIERLGYGGDGNASTLSLQIMADVMPLYRNWLQAWRDVMSPDGGLPHTAPSPYPAGGGPYWCSFIVQAPWRTYMSYGDRRILEDCYPDMKRWIGYVDAWSRDGLLFRWPDTDYRAWYLGDWLAPKGVDVTAQESVDLVNNCALSQSYADLVHIAGLLGKTEDAAGFSARLEALNARIFEKFYHPETATWGTGSQLDMIYPMLVGACPEDCLESVKETLMERSRTLYNGHLGVGLVGVPVLAEWATLAHEVDFVYGMLKQHTYPGYLYMIDNGATGTWEEWGGDRSHLHNCYNGILSWFYQALGGIIPVEAGYRTVRIDPQMPEGLDWVKVSVDTPYGPVSVSWDRSGGEASVDISKPSGIKVI